MKKPIQRTGRLKLLHRLLPQYLKYVGFHQRKLYHETLVSSKKPQRIFKNMQLPLQLFSCNQKRLSDHPNKQIYLENKKGPLDLFNHLDMLFGLRQKRGALGLFQTERFFLFQEHNHGLR